MPLSRLLIVIGFFLGGLHLYATSRPPLQTSEHIGSLANSITLLSAEWCGYCKALRGDLDRMGVAYQELDIDENVAGKARFEAVNARGVPVLIVGEDIVYGYDPDRTRELIAAAGYQLADR